ncbi:MAG: hypothetical protein HQL70_10870 [Magnetococcales bacterium]|nr:hypothetical protein [Magnetococcales bacterium]
MALLIGIRNVWRSRGSQVDVDGANSSEGGHTPLHEELGNWAKSTNGRLIITILSMLLLFMAVERVISVGDKIPADYTPVPSQTSE